MGSNTFLGAEVTCYDGNYCATCGYNQQHKEKQKGRIGEDSGKKEGSR